MSKSRVVVVDYGMGNVMSVRRAIERCGATPVLTDDPSEISNADRLVLPGVGAFGDCMAALEQRSLIEPMLSFVRTGRPFLGICVGMQILLDYGEEFAGYKGLGLIPGRVAQIPVGMGNGSVRKIPHIGWTGVRPPGERSWSGSLFAKTEPMTSLYFVHSFSAAPINPEHLLAVADYQGFAVTAAVKRDNITGTQFHPEKSGPAGLALITEFLAQ